MQYNELIANLLLEILQKHFQVTFEQTQILSLIEIPKDSKMGDLAFPCFLLAKQLRQGPPAIAQKLQGIAAQQLPEGIAQVQATGPYLNFYVSKADLASQLIPRILDGDFFKPRSQQAERVMIEYSQPNTHKAFHVGHTRNVALGDALVRLYRWVGYDVVAANYIGDEGTHIAKCLWYFQKYFRGAIPEQNRGEFLGELYVKATELLDFSLLTQVPIPGVVTARVGKIQKHPTNPEWSVVELDLGNRITQVVCGGKGYAVHDVCALALPGARIGGREVTKQDKLGVQSEGMLCSEFELGLSDKREKIYVCEATQQLGQQIAEVLRVPGALDPSLSVIETMKTREAEVADILKSMETGVGPLVDLWMQTRQWSLDEFMQIYQWLDVKFDHIFYESEVALAGKKLVDEYYAKGVFEKSDGAIGVNLESFQLPFFLVLKSNGTGLYSTKDLSLARRKFEEFQIDRSVYVVDEGQSLHFKQVFKTLELMGYDKAKKCYHLPYAKVDRPDGKMSSRKGNVILFSELKDRLIEKIRGEYLNRYLDEKDPHWSESTVAEAAHRIAVSTIKYGMLNQDNNKNIVFDLEEWTARSGNTGPYMMYAYARTRSILREVGKVATAPNWQTLTHESEQDLLRKLSEFPEVASRAALRFQPQMLCIYLYELSKDFSRMYTHCSVRHAESEDLKAARLQLVDATGQILKQGLGLLGITTIERM